MKYAEKRNGHKTKWGKIQGNNNNIGSETDDDDNNYNGDYYSGKRICPTNRA